MMSVEDVDSQIQALEREKRQLERRLLRCEQSVHLLQEVQRGNTNLLSSLLNEIEAEKAKSDALLHNILPDDVIRRLSQGAETIADSIKSASVVFTDFVGFTSTSAEMSASELVERLNALYSAFDEEAQRIGVEKIKTIGDAYLAVCGLSGEQTNHAEIATEFALALRDIVRAQNADGRSPWQMRTGVHSGSLTAGVIGRHKFAYDIWGDTVNVANRVQSVCPANEVLVSEATAVQLSDRVDLDDAHEVELKGRGRGRVFRVVGIRGARE